jgi:hypothetical protein
MAVSDASDSAILDTKYNFFSCKWQSKELLKSHACFEFQGLQRTGRNYCAARLFLGPVELKPGKIDA